MEQPLLALALLKSCTLLIQTLGKMQIKGQNSKMKINIASSEGTSYLTIRPLKHNKELD